jgi:MFS superfamily sulfate permease-like transporter
MMMIPQGMAYALVAGLPPVAGLYASIVPPLLYALFGTSSTQSVGPMAIISLMTASALAPLASAGSAPYGMLAAQLAMLSGGVLLLGVDAGLFFGNIEAVSQRIEEELAAHGGARHFVLVLSAVNAIDSSALFWLLELNRVLARRDVRLHLAEVKGPVLDRLRASTLLSELSGRLFLSTANAWDALARYGT